MSICFFSKVAAATVLYLLAMPTPAAAELTLVMALDASASVKHAAGNAGAPPKIDEGAPIAGRRRQ
jgi:hypothetical protein